MREEVPTDESSPGSPGGLRARRGPGFPASLGDRAVADAHAVLRVTTQRTCGEARTRRQISWLRASPWYIYAGTLRASPGLPRAPATWDYREGGRLGTRTNSAKPLPILAYFVSRRVLRPAQVVTQPGCACVRGL